MALQYFANTSFFSVQNIWLCNPLAVNLTKKCCDSAQRLHIFSAKIICIFGRNQRSSVKSASNVFLPRTPALLESLVGAASSLHPKKTTKKIKPDSTHFYGRGRSAYYRQSLCLFRGLPLNAWMNAIITLASKRPHLSNPL